MRRVGQKRAGGVGVDLVTGLTHERPEDIAQRALVVPRELERPGVGSSGYLGLSWEGSQPRS